MLKNKIQTNFSKAARSYDEWADIQKRSAGHLVALLKNVSPHTILDIGCGTGFVTEVLFPMFPHSLYTLNDISPEMLAQAKKRFRNEENIRYLLADAERDSFHDHDLIISNLAFQWFGNLPQAMQSLWKKTSCLAFSTLALGTFSEWSKVFAELKIPCRVSSYPDYSQLREMCRNLSPREMYFDAREETLFFDQVVDFVRYLRKIGASTSLRGDPLELRHILTRFPNGIHIEYKIFYALLIK